MKYLLVLIGILLTSPTLRADGLLTSVRKFGIFLGGGASRDWASLAGSNFKSRFEGWAPVAELGIDLPFTERFGIVTSAEYRQLDLTNTRADSLTIEKTSTDSTTLKAGLFLGPFGLSYGYGIEAMKIHQVSTTGGSTESQRSGRTQSYYASYTFRTQSNVRFAVEGHYRSGDVDTYVYTDAGVMLKLYFVLGAE